MFCCLFIICSSSLTTLSSSCHHLFHHVSVIFLSSLSCFTIFVHGYHLHMCLSSFCHLSHSPFLTLSSFLSSLSSSIPLLIICFVIFIILQPSSCYNFCHLVHPPILFLIIFLIIVSLLVIFAVVINFHQPDKIMAAFYILSDLACSFIFFIVI